MLTFLTALIWGLGVSLGASVGCMVFVLLFGFYREKDASKSREISERSLAALTTRNDLSEQQIAALERIAATMEEANK
jgi:hypothetical protein